MATVGVQLDPCSRPWGARSSISLPKCCEAVAAAHLRWLVEAEVPHPPSRQEGPRQ